MKELTAVQERLKGIIDTSVGVAGAMSALRINFSGDESLGADQLDEHVKEIAKKNNTSDLPPYNGTSVW